MQILRGNGLGAQLLKSSTVSALIHGLNILLALASGVVLARVMGPEGYGVYGFVLSMITLLALPANSGLPVLILREVAKTSAQKQWALMAGLFRFANRVIYGLSAVVGLLLVAALTWLMPDMDDSKAGVFLWATPLLPLLALVSAKESILRGLHWIAWSQIVGKLLRPLFLLILVGITVLFGAELTALSAMQFTALGALAAMLVGMLLLLKAVPRETRAAQPQYQLSAWTSSCLIISFFAGVKVIDSQVSMILLGLMGTDEQVGLFRVAATGATLVSFSLAAGNIALAPHVVRLYNAGELEKLQRMITLIARAVSAVALPVALILVFWGEQVIGLVFGEEYLPARTALAILCAGQFINVSAGSVALVLNMTGNDRATVASAVVALIVNILLELLLIPEYGLVGAAIGSTVSLSLWNISLMIVAKKKTGINTFWGAR